MISTAMRDGVQSLRNLSADDILGALGLEKRRSPVVDIVLPSLALFAAGAVVGAAAAVLLTPKTGPVLRRELTDGARDLTQRLGATAQAVQEYVGVGTGTTSPTGTSPTGTNRTHSSNASAT